MRTAGAWSLAPVGFSSAEDRQGGGSHWEQPTEDGGTQEGVGDSGNVGGVLVLGK